MIVLVLFSLSFSLDVCGGQIPVTMCSFSGTTSYRLPSEKDIPARCKGIAYGNYYLDTKEHISQSDLNGIHLAQSANLPVYVRVAFLNLPHWNGIMNGMTENSGGNDYKTYIQPMIDSFIKDKNIAGIILDYLGLFEAADSRPADYAKQINFFIVQMKISVPDIMVGITLDGQDNKNFANVHLFNFTTSNSRVDMYLIDMSTTGLTCDENTALNGRFPLTGGNMSLDVVTASIRRSDMDMGRVWINLKVQISVRLNSNNHIDNGRTYKEYCETHDSGVSSTPDLWCIETAKRCNEQAGKIKDAFSRIMISDLEMDDFNNACGCALFPVTNSYLDGFEKKDPDPCLKIG